MADDVPMQWKITVDESPALIRVKISGTFDVGKCKVIYDEIGEMKGSNPFSAILFDDREADLSGLAPADLIDLGNLFIRSQSVFAYSKVAFLMNAGRDLDTASKFQSITANKFVSSNIFSSEKKALKWIES